MKTKEPTKFHLQLEQLKIDHKAAIRSEDQTKAKELSKFIRNLQAIIKRLEDRR